MSLLTKRMVEKPWGKDVLPAPFAAPVGKRIGEVWFEPPPQMPSILVKYIFTSEKLSVQVHPNDAQAVTLGETDGGKEECWLVIGAEPGATLGIGFKEPVDAETMRRAALDGSIKDLMEWYPVTRGDFFYIPAGTVHAIGAGVSLIEVQQNSDITYRLYDYGRPRALHLDKGVEVARGVSLDPALRRNLSALGTVMLTNGPYFVSHRIEGIPSDTLMAQYAGWCLIIPLDGDLTTYDSALVPGECALVYDLHSIGFGPQTSCVIVRAA